MFDTVKFRYRMPDGETGPDYQTIELDGECASYQISADGRLLKWQTDVGGFADCIFRPKPTIDSDVIRSHFPI